MKRLFPIGAALLAAGAVLPTACAADYVVAVDRETQADGAWQSVVDTLKAKHSADVLVYEGRSKVAGLLPDLRRLRPKYVCFVTKPENAGRELVINIAQTLRKIDDDPYGDALWGIVTGYEAADAMRLAKTPTARTIGCIANSEGRPEALEGWRSGFISDERSPSNIWFKAEGRPTELHPTGGNIAKALAEAFNGTPFDYFLTSGHATQRDWQIVYNKDVGSLRHDDAGNLFFLHTDGSKYPVKSETPKVYLAAGNCLIGDIDRRSCMTTAWLHSGGLEQFCGYTCVTFYGFMGWGIRTQFEQVRCAFSEAHYLQNQMLLWALGQKKAALVTKPIRIEDFANGRKVGVFVEAHKADLPDQEDSLGLLWDRDIVAFYGDPAERVTCPESHRTVRVTVKGESVEVSFLKDLSFESLSNVKDGRPIMQLLDEPPVGTRLLDAAGREVPNAVVNDRFLLIPMTGRHPAGETLRYRIAYGQDAVSR